MNKLIPAVSGLLGIIATVFAGYHFLEHRHIDTSEQAVEALKTHQRILYSESTRYAEIAKYYYELQQERPLTLAETTRLRLVEKQQERVSKELLGTIQQ